MCRTRAVGLVSLMPLITFFSACAAQPQPSPRDVADANDTGRRIAPSNEGERAILHRLQQLPSGAPQHVGNVTVLAEQPYHAASGQTCRPVHVTEAKSAARHRLACSDGKSWFFVPDIFGNNSAE
jgi:hypothetical protein